MIYSKLFSFLFLVLFLSQAVSAVDPGAVNLGSAGDFAILTKSGISTTGTTSIVGNIGVSPIDSTAITGFGLIMDPSNTFSTSSLVNGKIYAADYTSPTPTKMTTAISDMEAAFTDAQGRTHTNIVTELGAGDISGKTITPGLSNGLYKWGTGVLINAGGSGDPNGVTLDCQGNSSAVFIFQIAQDLTVGNGARVTLIGGCQANNIFWAVNGGVGVAIGTTAHLEGNILASKAITFNTGATLKGRALAQTAVTLDANAITVPSESINTPTPTPDSAPTNGGSSGSGGSSNSNFNNDGRTISTGANETASTAEANGTGLPSAFAEPSVDVEVQSSTALEPAAPKDANENLLANPLALPIAAVILIGLAVGLYYYFGVMKK